MPIERFNRYFRASYFSARLFRGVAAISGRWLDYSGAHYPTEEELAAAGKHQRRLEAGTKWAKRKRERFFRRLGETVELAYLKAKGFLPQEPDAPLEAPPLAPNAPVYPVDPESVQALVQAIEQHANDLAAAQAATQAAMAQAEADRIEQDEEDVELLLLAA